MKKFYTLFLSFFAIATLSFNAKAGDILDLWGISYGSGKIDVYTDAALTKLVLSDAGSEDGAEVFVDADECLDGFYVVVTPDEDMMLDLLFAGGMMFEDSDLDNNHTIHIAMDEIDDPEWGIFFEAYFKPYEPAISGIEEVAVDLNAADVEYFNLHGIRVDADNLTSGLYIARRGNRATKVLVK